MGQATNKIVVKVFDNNLLYKTQNQRETNLYYAQYVKILFFVMTYLRKYYNIKEPNGIYCDLMLLFAGKNMLNKTFFSSFLE